MKKFIYTAEEGARAVKKYQENFIRSRTMLKVFKIIRAESKQGHRNYMFYFDSPSDAYDVFRELEKLGYKLHLYDPTEHTTQYSLWVSWW